jgi:glycosyltransferase involved in cell wall biosynthesis
MECSKPAKKPQQKDSDDGLPMRGTPIGTEPLVSIIIPYYNQPAFLAGAVLSAKQQTYPNAEIIVVDDGSAIPADSLLQQVSDILILRTGNRGVAAARNLGFQRSSGDFLIFLDSDDRLLPGTIEAHLQALREHPDAGLSFGPVKIIDQNGNEIRPAHICRPRKDYFLMLLEGNPVGSPGAAMMRREAFIAAGHFDESFWMAEDYDLYLRIARQVPLVQHAFCALEYREHSANTSQAHERMLACTMAVLDRIEPLLTDAERRRLPHARRRWGHLFRRRPTFTYRVKSLYYSALSMWNIPPVSYFGYKR